MQNTLNTLFQQWAWDILYPLDGQNQFIGSDGFERSEIARLIGAENWFNEENPYDPAAGSKPPTKHGSSNTTSNTSGKPACPTPCATTLPNGKP